MRQQDKQELRETRAAVASGCAVLLCSAARAEAHGVTKASVRNVLVAKLPSVREVHPSIPGRILDLDVPANPRIVRFTVVGIPGPAATAFHSSTRTTCDRYLAPQCSI